jgi:hypothetical protein
MIRRSGFAWRRPRHELVLLGLVVVGTLLAVHPPGAQDTSRMCVTRAIPHGSLSANACLAGTLDRAEFRGHLYTDKPPGVSFLAVPAAAAVGLQPGSWNANGDLRLWVVRFSTGGLALLVCAFMLGRVAEGLAPGWGGATLVTFAAGTLAASLAVDNFGEVPAAMVGFAAFVLAWRGRPGWAGLVAGLGLLVEYQSALVATVVGVYATLAGLHAAFRFVLGLLPGLALLGAYDQAAFGSPFHLSYRYVFAQFAAQQAGGFFGIHSPSAHAARLVLVGNRGLIVVAPVLILAAAGLMLLWRGGRRAESLVCAAVTILFLLLEFGYYDPYGGDSPGPRFFIPALPFLALGLAPAFARWRTTTTVLAAASVIASTAVLLTWPKAVNAAEVYRWSVWRELGLLARHGARSELASWTGKTVFSWIGVGPLGGAAILAAAALGALGLALRDGWVSRSRRA